MEIKMRHLSKKTLTMLGLAILFAAAMAVPAAARPSLLTNSLGTVVTHALNVRAAPGTHSEILTVITQTEVFPVVGRTADSSWCQILLNPEGATGWVSGVYLNVAYEQGVPVTHTGSHDQDPSPPFLTNSLGTVMVYALNVRAAPDTDSDILTVITQSEVFPVVGRTADSGWWQILLNPEGATGWVCGAFLNVAYGQGVPAADLGGRTDSQPPADSGPGSSSSGHYWTTVVDVNIRSGPGTAYDVIAGLFAGMPAHALRRNASGTWVRIRTDSGLGWITSTALPSYANLSVLPVVS